MMKRYDKTGKRFRRFLRRYINGTKGVISLFLAILMLPFVSVGGALLNAARVDSAIAIFDEALCNASNSTLGTYDSFLRTRFGLLAMSQDTSAHGGGYTAQDLISETFEFYMEQNVAALSNTYVEIETDAAGIYPLADTGVLLSEVLEYGKYAVPTKLVIDGLCINDIIDSLSGSADLITNLLDTATSGLETVDQFVECQDKFNTAFDKLRNYEMAKEQYVAAYTAFETAVDEYNVLIEEREQKISECDQAVSSAESDVSSAESSLAGEDEAKDPAAYGQAQDDLENAEEALEEARSRREAVIQEYQGKLDAQRAEVENSKSLYIVQIDAFANAVKEAGSAVVEAQEAYSALEKAGIDLAINFTGTVCELRKQGIENQIDDMEKSQTAANKRGDSVAENACRDQIAEASARKDSIEAENTLIAASADARTAARDTLNNFAVEKYNEKFNEIYTDLIALKGKVEGYTVESGYETKMSATNEYFDNSITEPLKRSQLQNMLEELLSSIVESAFFATIKALTGFIQAIAKVKPFFDPELNAVIDETLFPGGMLPSQKDPGRLVSAFEAEDSRKSEYYKELLSGYSSDGITQGNGKGADSLIDKMMEDIEQLAGCFGGEWSWSNLFSKLGELASAVATFVGDLLLFVVNAVALINEVIGQKILLTGYVAYNIPNRTTYTGSALTGSSYQLPSVGSVNQGYAFYGAETEYIMKGQLDEIANQTLVFANIWMIRILIDAGFVIANKEVSMLAQGAGCVTFGIGMVLIYAAFIVGEAYVDTLILANGGNVPIWKGTIYLTPTGIPDLIEAFYNLPLGDDLKNQITNGAKEVAESTGTGGSTEGEGNTGTGGSTENGGNTGSGGSAGSGENAGTGGSAGSGGNTGTGGNAGSGGNTGTGGNTGSGGNTGTGGSTESGTNKGDAAGGGGSESVGDKIVDSLTFDYTKTLIIAMLFENKEKMLNRLADVIQMEASYQAVSGIGRYDFDLDQSYTYLRSSGSFQMNEFLPISDRTGIHSKDRVIYRGY